MKKKDKEVLTPEQHKRRELEIWFAKNHKSTGFDLSAIGFYNWLNSNQKKPL